MALRWGGFTGKITGVEKEDILQLGKAIDDELATGRRDLSQLSKDEKRALVEYRNIRAKRPMK